MFFLNSLVAVLAAAGLAAASPLKRAVTNTTASGISELWVGPNGTWIEGLAVRPSGEVLISLLNEAQLLQVNPHYPGKAVVVFEDLNHNSFTDVTEIEDDVYAVTFGNTTVKEGTGLPYVNGTYGVWKVDMKSFKIGHDGSVVSPATVTKIADMPEAQWINGVIAPTTDYLLVADSKAASVYRVDLATGNYQISIADTLMMAPPYIPFPLGINGMKVLDGFLYFANSVGGWFAKIPINADGFGIGNATKIATGYKMNDFVFDRDGAAVMATDGDNSVVGITTSGSITNLIGGENSTVIKGPTDVGFGRTAFDSTVLYAGTNGGAAEPTNPTGVVPGRVVAIYTSDSY